MHTQNYIYTHTVKSITFMQSPRTDTLRFLIKFIYPIKWVYPFLRYVLTNF